MTNEAAIEKLAEIRHRHDERVFISIGNEDVEALDMAIAALEKAPTRYSRTLVVKVPEEDIDKVGRIRLECKPWCRLFYEDCDRDISAPAHSALDHIYSVVKDDAYRRGYGDGKDTNVPTWIPVSERLPACEQEVLICTKVKPVGKDAYIDSIITPAIYEDGTMLENDSRWSWEEVDWAGWDEEEDCGIIPEGWWENRHFNPDDVLNYQVDREVVAWMPLPQPYGREE